MHQIELRKAAAIEQRKFGKFQLRVFRQPQDDSVLKLDFGAAIPRRQAEAFLDGEVHRRVLPIFLAALVLDVTHDEAQAHNADVRVIVLVVLNDFLGESELRAARGKNRGNKQC